MEGIQTSPQRKTEQLIMICSWNSPTHEGSIELNMSVYNLESFFFLPIILHHSDFATTKHLRCFVYLHYRELCTTGNNQTNLQLLLHLKLHQKHKQLVYFFNSFFSIAAYVTKCGCLRLRASPQNDVSGLWRHLQESYVCWSLTHSPRPLWC